MYNFIMLVTMKNAILWEVVPCGSSKNRHFGRILNHQGGEISELGKMLAVIRNFPP
jgi:hypothetical protein